MKLESGIVIHTTDEAKKKWEGKERPVKKKKCNCSSCEIEKLKKKNDYNNSIKEKSE
jgi:hypothetical protein